MKSGSRLMKPKRESAASARDDEAWARYAVGAKAGAIESQRPIRCQGDGPCFVGGGVEFGQRTILEVCG